MAWTNNARLSGRQLKGMFRMWRRPPPPDLPSPNGVPTSVMRSLASEGLPLDPIKWNRRLQELLAAYPKNGG